MVITSSTENATDSKPPSENSSTVWIDPVESGSPKGEESDQPKEEEGECVFCVFMKGGGCREPFTAWEVCMEEAEKNKEDIFTKCMEVNSALFKCMDAHSDYYKPILAKKAAAEQVKEEFEAEKKNKVDQEEISEEEVAARKQAQG
ncbi:unnamed protein product [Brassica oleracea var. botrytis]